MRILRVTALFLLLAVGASAAAAEQAVFGPAKYNIKERYGRPNRFTVPLAATEGLYVIKIENGEKPAERPDYLALQVNGKQVLIEDRYLFPVLACFVMLEKQNTIELFMRDEQPAGFRRPPATPRNAVITVLPVSPSMKALRGSFGIGTWEALKNVAERFQPFKSPAAALLAMDSVSFHLDRAGRAAAVRKLSDLKDPASEAFYLAVFNDLHAPQEVRAEIVLALAATGKKEHIPLLVRTVLDPEEKVSIAAARGLSLFPEEDSQEEVTKAIESLDQIRKNATIRTIVNSGWKPITTLINLSASKDAYIANIALSILGRMREPRATDHLIKLLQDPGDRNAGAIIRALGETGDTRSADALIAFASDPAKRQGKEVELADAFVALGDKRAAGPLAEMIRKPSYPAAEGRLRNAYRRLTGKDY